MCCLNKISSRAYEMIKNSIRIQYSIYAIYVNYTEDEVMRDQVSKHTVAPIQKNDISENQSHSSIYSVTRATILRGQ